VSRLRAYLEQHGIGRAACVEKQDLVNEVEMFIYGEREVSVATFEARCVAAPPSVVVFLDVDGVLNSIGFRAKQLNPRCIVRLVTLLRASGAKIVLSTSWRTSNPMKRTLLHTLRRHGIPSETIVGQTPECPAQGKGAPFSERAHEVREWLAQHDQVRAWIAVDDNNYSGMDPDFFAGHFLHTDGARGITDDDVARGLMLLEAQGVQLAQQDCNGEGVGAERQDRDSEGVRRVS